MLSKHGRVYPNSIMHANTWINCQSWRGLFIYFNSRNDFTDYVSIAKFMRWLIIYFKLDDLICIDFNSWRALFSSFNLKVSIEILITTCHTFSVIPLREFEFESMMIRSLIFITKVRGIVMIALIYVFVKVAGNSLYNLMLQSWYQKKAQSLLNTLSFRETIPL